MRSRAVLTTVNGLFSETGAAAAARGVIAKDNRFTLESSMGVTVPLPQVIALCRQPASPPALPIAAGCLAEPDWVRD